MARRYFRRKRSSWFRPGRKNPSKKISVVNVFATLLAVLGIGVPVAQEAYLAYKTKPDIWSALTGAGDMLSTMFLGRKMNGGATQSTYKYQGWYVIGGAAGIVLVNKVLRMFAGRIPIYGRWTVN